MFDINELKQKMSKTIMSFQKDLSTLRTGRANPSMLDLIKIDVYGQKMPINQIATVTVPEPRTISIQVWDKNNVKTVDSEIQKSNLEFFSIMEGDDSSYSMQGFDPNSFLPDEDVYKPKKKESSKSKGLEKFMEKDT